MTRDEASLLGVWSLVRSEDPEFEIPGAVQVFHPGGRLQYLVPVAGGFQGAELTYRVEGDEIVTNQPSAPGEERTRFRFDNADTLCLDYAGRRTWYHRETPTVDEVLR